MQKAKKVRVEVVSQEKKNKFRSKVTGVINRVKIFVAIVLDGIDFIIGWIPIINTLWDIVTFIILLIILKNKRLAFFSLIELPFVGLPPFSLIDMFIPVATLLTLIDNSFGEFKRVI
jgi:hypothetical protein